MTVESFLRENTKRDWIKDGHYDMYVRRTVHFIDSASRPCFDIASISCEQHLRGCGGFWRLLTKIEDLVKNDNSLEYVFIENIGNKRLAASLRNRGYSRHYGIDDNTTSLYLKVK